jgi:cytochrome c553
MWRIAIGLSLSLPLLAQVDFATTIHPILVTRCAPCHSGPQAPAGFSVESRPAILSAIMPGKPSESLLLKRVKAGEMPPSGGKLSDAQITSIENWIAEGAPWTDTTPALPDPNWSAPIKPRTPALPASAAANPIDKFLEPHDETVDDALFIRRATLDVWGMVPSYDATKKFIADKDPSKRGRLIDFLLSDKKKYAEHWISFWNDLLRNDQGVNYAGTRKSITPWLLAALENNMPFNQMASALLSPEKPDDPDGFLTGVNWRGDINASQTPFMQAAQNSAQVFLGVNLKCASCHDSFINKYKLKQSYALAAMFAETSDLELVRCDAKIGKHTGPEFLFPDVGVKPVSDSLADRRKAAALSFTNPENGRFPRTLVNRYWQRLLGRGIVANVDEMDAQPWNADLLDWLASDFAQHNYDLKYLIKLIMTSRSYALPAVLERGETFRGPKVRRLTAEQFADSLSEMTGEWRVSQSGEKAAYAREWELKSTPLTRAMGRPIRDQVFTTREDSATTLQALELVNGDTLAIILKRGAARMLGELPDAPQNLFDSRRINKGAVPLDVDISGAKQLWLYVDDAGCYDPARTVAGWLDLKVDGKPVAELPTIAKPAIGTITADKVKHEGSILAPVGSLILYPIDGLGFKRLTGAAGIEDSARTSDINPNVRFFVFTEKPDLERLLRVSGDAPTALPAPSRDPKVLIDRLFWEALSRRPNPREVAVATKLLVKDGKVTQGGLEDLIWSLIMHPEFQYVQ